MYLNRDKRNYNRFKSYYNLVYGYLYMIIIPLLLIIMLFISAYLTFKLVWIYISSDLYSAEKILILFISITTSYLNIFSHDLNMRFPNINRYMYLYLMITSRDISDLNILVIWIVIINLTFYALNRLNNDLNHI